MRLWSIAPELLDRAALVATWREGLLAQKVLRGLTQGYRNHPQLERFRALEDPVSGVATWLDAVASAADRRGYSFDRSRIAVAPTQVRLPLTTGQLELERLHLVAKVQARDPAWLRHVDGLDAVAPHPMFDVVEGPAASWERAEVPGTNPS